MTKHYANRPSRLLNDIQNKGVFACLGAGCSTLVTTVAVMRGTVSTRSKWIDPCFGILCIEKDSEHRKYYFRFYRMIGMNLLVDLKMKKFFGTPFSVMRRLLLKIEEKISKVLFTMYFEFVDTPAGQEEYYLVTKAMRGNLKALKREAESRWYAEHPDHHTCSTITSTNKESRLKRLFHRKKEESIPKRYRSNILITPSADSSPFDGGEAKRVATSALAGWACPWEDTKFKTILSNLGVELEETLKSKDCCQELEQTITKYGGKEIFMQTSVQHGFGSGSDESSPEIPSLSSVPKTPPKFALDTIAAFEPAKQVGTPKNDDPSKSLAKLFEVEDELASSSPRKLGTPEKVAEPVAKEKVGKLVLADAFVSDLNMVMQRITEKQRKLEEEEKNFKKEQKAKKGLPVSSTPEQTPEKEAPTQTEKTSVKEASKTPEKEASKTPEKEASKTPEKEASKTPEKEASKTPEKEASKTPEKDPSSVSDTSDETESDSDNPD